MCFHKQLIKKNLGELLIVVLLYSLLVIIKFFFIFDTEFGPTIFLDETIYKNNAESIAFGRIAYNVQYPPFYSLVIAPAFLFSDWYKAMIIINIFISSMILPATWLLAKSLYIKHTFWVLIIVSLLPFHFIYPNKLLSENLFVPLFVLVVALTLRGGRLGIFEGFFYGLIMGLTHLTKYLMLPAIPVLFFAWFYILSNSTIRSKSKLPVVFSAVFSYLSIMGLWFIYGIFSGNIYGIFSGNKLFDLLGLGISGIKIKELSIQSFIMWSTAYLTYLILSGIITWAMALIWLSRQKLRETFFNLDLQNRTYLILCALLTLGFLALAIQHSIGAKYNYPQPYYLIGRYLVLLMPLKVVLAFFFLSSITQYMRPPNIKIYMFFSILLSALIYCSWLILYDQFIWPFPNWFAAINFNSIETFIFKERDIFMISFGTVVLLLIYGLFKRVTVLVLVLAFIVTNTVNTLAVFPLSDNHGSHAKYVAPIISDLSDKDRILGLVIGSKIDLRVLRSGLDFFGIKRDRYVLHEKITQNLMNSKDPIFLISGNLKTSMPVTLKEYRLNNTDYTISSLNGYSLLNFKPEILRGGYVEEKNAIWVEVHNLSQLGLVIIDGHQIQLTPNNRGIATFRVPDFVNKKNKDIYMYLFDTLTDLESKPFKISFAK